MKIRGQCGCGAIAYEIAAGTALDVAICHCRACRQSTGGTHVTWATLPRQAFRWTRGRPRTFASRPQVRRYFCGHCGAQLALVTERAPDTINVTVATLRDADRHAPRRHIWTIRKLKWLTLPDRLPRERREFIPPKAKKGR